MIHIYTWFDLSNDINNYVNTNLFPNLMAFSIAKLYNNNKELLIDLSSLYNSLKSILNVTNDNKQKVLSITKHILEKEYNIVNIDI